ncbi:MAG: Tm-1-like ATP-binding domain-containing protein [Pleomorphochaeta sp.]
MKNVAIVASCDTKFKEVEFMKDSFISKNINPIVIDISIGLENNYKADITREAVFKSINKDWQDIKNLSKGDLITLMMAAIKIKVLELYSKNLFDGIISMGGVQNTYIATSAMRALDLGVPKVITTTIACGKRSFDQVVGQSDIVVIPSISDFTGLNIITEMSMSHAISCMQGMLLDNERALKKSKKKVVGVTLMGISNTGAQAAINELEKNGIEAIGFHATGVGGYIMDNLASTGIIDGILDLNLHEISSEHFKGGFSYGDGQRLIDPIEKNIPIILAPAGLDFIDYKVDEFPFALDKRKYVMHNSILAHIKITKEEALEIGTLLGNRLSNSKMVIEMLVPTNGFRANTMPNEKLYDPEIDNLLIETIKAKSKGKIKITYIEGNLNEKQWGLEAAKKMIKLLGEQNV